VTCPSLLRRSSAGAVVVDDLPPGRTDPARRTAARVVARLRRDDTFAQFARFVLVGGSTTAVYAVLFLSLSRLAGLSYLPAHVAATTVTTVLANEMHRRLTFRAEDRVSWPAAQWEAGGVSVVGLVATSSALEWLDSVTGTAHPAVQVAVVATVTAAIGCLRFIALRWIFRPTGVRVAQ
jgi:putative flippase GtrA